MLELSRLTVRRPDGRVVVAGVDLRLARGNVVLIAGENGSGKTALCRALTGRLEHGWRIGGSITWRAERSCVHDFPIGQEADQPPVELVGLGAGDLGGLVGVALADPLERAMRLRPRGEESVQELLTATARTRPSAAGMGAGQLLAHLGLEDLASLPSWRLTRAQRWAVAVAQAVVGPPPVVVLDGVLGHLGGRARDGLLDILPAVARLGSAVLWSDNLLGPAARISDIVVELHRGSAVSSPVGQWQPRGGNRSALMTLVDGLGLDHALWNRPAAINEELRHGGDRPMTVGIRRQHAIRTGARGAQPPVEVDHRSLGIDHGVAGAGRDTLEFRAGERVGVLCTDPDRARSLVTPLAHALGAPGVGPAESLLARESVGAAFGHWDRRHPPAIPTGDVFTRLLGPQVRLPRGALRADTLSAGQRIAARIAMLLAGSGPCVMPDPSVELDAAAIGRLREILDDGANGTRMVVIIGSRPDLLMAICHRIVEIEGRAILQDGGPLFVQRSVSCRSPLSTACAPLMVTSADDALDLLGGPRAGATLPAAGERLGVR